METKTNLHFTEYQELLQQLHDACEEISASFALLIEVIHKMAEEVRELFSKLSTYIITKFRRYGFLHYADVPLASSSLAGAFYCQHLFGKVAAKSCIDLLIFVLYYL